MRSVSVGRSPAITSSSSSNFGSVASARATSSRLRSGRVSVEAMLAALVEQAEARAARARACSRAAPTSCRCSKAPTITLSSTLKAGNGRTSWKVRATPRRHTASGASPAMGSPASAIEPSSGACAPAIRLNSVVLPAPFGPIRAKMAALGHVEADAIHREQAAEALLTSSTRAGARSCLHRSAIPSRRASHGHMPFRQRHHDQQQANAVERPAWRPAGRCRPRSEAR